MVPLVKKSGLSNAFTHKKPVSFSTQFPKLPKSRVAERSDSAGYKFLELVGTYTDGLGLQHMTGGSTNDSQNAAAGCDQFQNGIAGSTANELAGNCNGQNSGARKASRKSTICRLIRQHCPRTAGLPI